VLFINGKNTGKAFIRGNDEWEYAAMITLLDEQVGQIVKKLKDEGLYDNTIITRLVSLVLMRPV
jgi:phosphoglycerol transferase MdoB-like AlkP superfamily enzyme